MEPLFCAGFCRELKHNDLYAHPSEADSEELLKRFNQWVIFFNSEPVYYVVLVLSIKLI